jgi:hypothetical protein
MPCPDPDFDRRLAGIVRPYDLGDVPGMIPASISLTLFAAGLTAGMVFAVLAVLLHFFCLGFVAIYLGGMCVTALCGAGFVTGLLTIVLGYRQPAALFLGVCGTILNGTVAAGMIVGARTLGWL